jgi:hypothetical protein
MKGRRDPETPDEWRDAVDAAAFVLALDSCRQYGLIEWDQQINVDRCIEILAEGRRRGIEPVEFPSRFFEGADNEKGN